MITILTGLPRSGKSYRAVWQIQQTFIDPKSKDYAKHRYLYTNIGGFKHDVVNETLSQNPIVTDDDVIVKESIYLDWDVFYSHIEKLFMMALDDKPDEELLRYAAYHKLTPAYIVIDEAYRFYSKRSDPVLVWLNGYHGHLGLDLVIIIHRPTLMHSDYKAHTEEFIDAQPKSKSLTNNQFRYFFYSTDYYTKADRYETDRLTAKPEIFALYKSGDLHKPKKVLYKFIGLALFAALCVFLLFKFLFHRFDSRVNPNGETPSASTSQTASAPVPSHPNLSGKSLLRVRCDATSCARIDSSLELHFIPRPFFEELLKLTDYKMITVSEVSVFQNKYFDFLYFVDSDFIKLFPSWSIPIKFKSDPLIGSVSVNPTNPIESGVAPK
ncbi:zonular occludens toxin domain-containing protein [Sulfuricurvum sp.]|uniref:zonular occludens toxin domain-containing protein n=1 Tax=Sulfuricurvum sp. TaxID=2025608 RepID=UPI0035698B44